MIFVDMMAASWLVFIAYWIVSSLTVKRDISRYGSPWLSVAGRLLVVVAIILLLRLPLLRQTMQESIHRLFLVHPAVRAAGAILCAAGVALAIWARVHLGANWSGRPATKEAHEFITSGPYRFVRHPIYSGMLVAMVGTFLVSGLPGLLALIGFSIVVLYRIRVEERLMVRLFADRHLRYRKHTKALIPHLI